MLIKVDFPPDCTDTDEQKQFFASNPAAYLEHRKALESKINSSFRGNIAGHQIQKLTREVRYAVVSPSPSALTGGMFCSSY